MKEHYITRTTEDERVLASRVRADSVPWWRPFHAFRLSVAHRRLVNRIIEEKRAAYRAKRPYLTGLDQQKAPQTANPTLPKGTSRCSPNSP